MTEREFQDFVFDKLVDLSLAGAESESRRRSLSICVGCLASVLARRFVLDLYPLLKTGMIDSGIVENVGREAAVTVFEIEHIRNV